MTFCPSLSRPFVSHGVGLSGPIKSLMPATKIEIGLAVKRACENRGMSQSALASALGVDPDTIKKIESGKRVTQWEWCGRVAEALGVTPNELLGFPIVSPDNLASALRPILANFGYPPDDADSIARILLGAVSVAQSLPDDGPAELRYKIAGQSAVVQFRGR